jgi:sensor histidine kinase YesM
VRHAAGFLIAAVLHGALVIALTTAVLGSPSSESFAQMLVNQVRARVYMEIIVYAGIVALGQAMAMYARWRDRDAQAAALEAQLASARLDALRAQLQPHFLFNSLHAVASLVREGRNADAVRTISGLGDLLRQMLDSSGRESTLGEEIALVRHYIDIQQVRFGDRLRVDFEIEPGVEALRVPPLVLQPLVENALRHGVEPRAAAGHVIVRARRDGSHLILDVEDDGVGVGDGWSMAAGTGTGLRNLAARVEALFGRDAGLTAGPATPRGFLARLRLPVKAA